MQRRCREFTGGAGTPAGGSGGGPGGVPPSRDRCSLSPRTHLTSRPRVTTGRQSWGTPGLGRAAAGSCAWAVPWGWGAPAVSPRGEGSRERQDGPPSGKQESPAETQGRPRVWAARRRGWGDPGLPWAPADGVTSRRQPGRAQGWQRARRVGAY